MYLNLNELRFHTENLGAVQTAKEKNFLKYENSSWDCNAAYYLLSIEGKINIKKKNKSSVSKFPIL